MGHEPESEKKIQHVEIMSDDVSHCGAMAAHLSLQLDGLMHGQADAEFLEGALDGVKLACPDRFVRLGFALRNHVLCVDRSRGE